MADEPASTGPDYTRRDLEELARVFRWFGEVECPQLDAHLYRALSLGVADDSDLLALAAHARAQQPPPNQLFGAVHYLLLGGAEHPLREWYPGFAGAEGARGPDSAFPAFRDFCLAHREAVVGLIEKRLTQTNVVQRCSALLPAFTRVHAGAGGAPLAMIEIGPSAGLNMQWDQFRYSYGGGELEWGDPASGVLVEAELRGDARPSLSPEIPVAWRRGVDIHPIDIADEDAVRWLRALIWPEHVGRQERLTRAIEIARRSPPEIVCGSAAEKLPDLIAGAPPDARVCVYGTHTLYQFPTDALRATLKGMQAASRERPVDFVTIEGTGHRCSEVKHVAYRDGERETTLLAHANAHGRWLEWLANPPDSHLPSVSRPGRGGTPS